MKTIFLLSCLLLVLASPTYCKQLNRFISSNEKYTNASIENGDIAEMWFNQTLDHFSSTGTSRTWSQRYFISKQHYRPGGPAFIHIGGEGAAEGDKPFLSTGSWAEYAKEVGAVAFLLEHRYYGKSRPTPDLSTENLKWLSSQQALADLAAFRNAMAKEHGLETAKWVSFGCSYAGSLSAWFRLKYPNLVDVAVCSSAPLQAVVDFKEYNVHIGESISKIGGQTCYSNIRNALYTTKAMLRMPYEWIVVSEAYNTCKMINVTKNKNDTAYFFVALAGIFDSAVVSYNLNPKLLDTMCDMMKANNASTFVNYVKATRYFNHNGCLTADYTSYIKPYLNTSYGGFAASQRAWKYQTCNEFGFYISSDAKNQPFGDEFPVEFFMQQCTDIFGSKFNPSTIRKAVSDTNAYYGGKNYTAKKTIFINGSNDPWHVLGLSNTSFKDDRLIILIKGTTHCTDMLASTPQDSPQLIAAREMVGKTLKYWLES